MENQPQQQEQQPTEDASVQSSAASNPESVPAPLSQAAPAFPAAVTAAENAFPLPTSGDALTQAHSAPMDQVLPEALQEVAPAAMPEILPGMLPTGEMFLPQQQFLDANTQQMLVANAAALPIMPQNISAGK